MGKHSVTDNKGDSQDSTPRCTFPPSSPLLSYCIHRSSARPAGEPMFHHLLTGPGWRMAPLSRSKLCDHHRESKSGLHAHNFLLCDNKQLTSCLTASDHQTRIHRGGVLKPGAEHLTDAKAFAQNVYMSKCRSTACMLYQIPSSGGSVWSGENHASGETDCDDTSRAG